MKTRVILILGLLLGASAANAVITFEQLSSDIFVISHRIKIVGSRGRAMKLVYQKAASVCVAAGYEFYEILDQESNAAQQYESANASIRVQYYWEPGSGRIGCQENADTEYVAQAREKLAKKGYVQAERPVADESSPAVTASSSCTVEQITAMVRAGLSDDQISAACPEDD